MSPETGRLKCLANQNIICDCPWLPQNASQMNQLGKDRGLRGTIQRLGYDKVNVGLITRLLQNPYGSYYSEAFERKLYFSPEMRGVRNYLLRVRMQLLLDLEVDPDKIGCTKLRQFFATYPDTDRALYLAYLQITLYLPKE